MKVINISFTSDYDVFIDLECHDDDDDDDDVNFCTSGLRHILQVQYIFIRHQLHYPALVRRNGPVIANHFV